MEYSKVRDPFAHTGGPVEVLAQDDLLGNYILLKGMYDIKDIIERLGNRKKVWLMRMKELTSLATKESDSIFEQLIALINQSEKMR